MDSPLVTAIVVNWNTKHLLPLCLESLRTSVADEAMLEFVVVDNGSTDGSVDLLQTHFPHVRTIANGRNLGFAAANNRGMEQARGDFFLLFNSDAVAAPGAVEALLAVALAQPRAGIVGARLLNQDGSFQASHSRFPSLLQEALVLSTLGRRLLRPSFPSAGPGIEAGPRRVDWVEGACLLVRREAWQEAGGLDEGYFMYAEEVDWCRTLARCGWQTWYAPAARVVHFGGSSSRTRPTQREADLYRSRVRFMRKHYGRGHAAALKGLIVTSTAAKVCAHALLRQVRPAAARPVVGLRQLRTALRDV